MLIAARNAMMAGGKPTAKSYVQDGLIAMWDGIENAGWGVHDPNATVWKDLVGAHDFTHIGAITRWSDDSAVFDGSNCDGSEVWNLDGIQTLEVVGKSQTVSSFAFCLFAKGSDRSNAFRMFSILPTSNRGFLFSSGAPSMFKDWSGKRWSVAATWSSAGSIAQSAQYYNGQFSPSNSGTSYWVVPTNLATLGRYQNDQYRYLGEICSIRANSRALTADEIAANYVVDKARFNLP